MVRNMASTRTLYQVRRQLQLHMYRLTQCLAGIKARYSPGVGDLATDRRSSEYTVPPPRTGVIHTQCRSPFKGGAENAGLENAGV